MPNGKVACNGKVAHWEGYLMFPSGHNGRMGKSSRPIPHYVREWREYRGLNQKQLSERVGIGESAVSKIETGAKPLMQSRLEKFRDAFGLDEVADLFRPPPSPDRPEDDLTRHLKKLKTREDRAKAARILAAAFGEEKLG